MIIEKKSVNETLFRQVLKYTLLLLSQALLSQITSYIEGISLFALHSNYRCFILLVSQSNFAQLNFQDIETAFKIILIEHILALRQVQTFLLDSACIASVG